VDEVLGCFLDEAREHLGAFAEAVLRLERDPLAPGAVDDMFRAMHTVKGAAGFLALSGTEELAHAAEDVLGRMRDGALSLTPGLASLLLAACDAIGGHLADIAAHGEEQGRDTADLVVRLRAAASGATEPSPARTSVGAADTVAAPAARTSAVAADTVAAPAARTSAVAADTVAVDGGARTLRVGTAALDTLMELVGGLVTVRNAVRLLATAREDVALARCAGELERVSAGMRDAVRDARTQQVGTVWQSVPRVARDTALRTGRQVRVVLTGAELECDRDVLDAVREPLLHLVRNAVDHGIEDPGARVSAGKPAEGTVRLSARREGAHVRMELSDDGAGIDRDAVAARALAMGVVSADELERMSADDVVRLVLRAGLSTAPEVTTVSGRGVGMDVANLAVRQVGGRLDLVSIPGAGTTVTVHLPVSMGIAQVLTVEAGGARQALAVDRVVDLVRVEPDDRVQVLGGTAAGASLRWRGRTVPVVGLPGTAPADDGSVAFAVVRAGDGVVALAVEAFGDTEEVVVRPLDRSLESVVPCTGSALLGDGSVVLLLDASALARACGRAPTAYGDTDVHGDHGHDSGAEDVVLTVDAGGGRRLGLALADVVRVVEVGPDALHPVGSWDVVDLDGTLVPVVRPSRLLAPYDHADAGDRTALLPVVLVRTQDGGQVGIAVAAVEDLAPATSTAELAEDGLRGVVLVAGRPVGQLDVRRAVADALETPPTTAIAS
jgi:two-component system, chemotaxis family, sensor kinase CheA